MPLLRLTTSRVLSAIALLATAACADSPVGPLARGATAAAPLAATSAGTTSADARVAVTTLKRRSPLAQSVTVSFTTTSAGGSYDLPGTGLRVVVPAKAVPSSPFTITVTALPGSGVAYNFEPHGTVFRTPLTLSVELGATEYAMLQSQSGVEAGYFASTADINDGTGTALVSELRAVTANRATNRITFLVDHFSGYMLSSGRIR
jgi:hypothetical protein